MNDNLKQFSDEVAAKLKATIESPDFASFVEKTKSAGEDRTFEVVMSTSDEDRQGDALDQSGWDLKYFNLNPVVLWAHNYSGFPIGIVTDITIDGDKAIATGKFAPEGTNPEADLACKLYQQKILRTVSPGYIQNDDGTRELLEMSFCSVPAGRYALSMRQVAAIGYSTPELISKGFFHKAAPPPESKAEDDPVLGDACEGDDGTPGVLAKDPKNPDRLICVPNESKSNETQENMNDELTKNLKAEHERHSKAVMKHIDEFETKAVPEEDEKKAEDDKEGSDNSEMEKAIDEFETKMDSEHEEHLEKCMKAIDDAADKIDPEEKSIDEFKKAMEDEHLKHVKCFDKAIDEFKSETDGEPEKCEKAIADFRTKAEGELERHEQAHEDMVKAEFGEGEDDGKDEKKVKGAVAEEMTEDAELQAKYKKIDKAYSVFSAFISAYLDEKAAVDDYDDLLDEAVALMKNTETKKYPDSTIRPLIGKSGRTISAKTKAKVEAIMKSIEEFHSEHDSEHEKFTTKAIAALKELSGSPQDDDGKEDEDDESRPRKARSSTSGAGAKDMSELDAYLFGQRLVRQVNTATTEGLRQFNEKIKERTQRGR